MYTGSRPPGPQHFPSRMVRPQGMPLMSPPGVPPPCFPGRPPPVQSFMQPPNPHHSFGYYSNYHPQAGHSPNWPPNQYGTDYSNHPGMYTEANGFNINVETSDTWSGSELSKSSDRSRGKVNINIYRGRYSLELTRAQI